MIAILCSLTGALATELGAGFGVTMLLIRRRPKVAEAFAMAWLLGVAFNSILLWAGSLVIRNEPLYVLVGLADVSLGVIGFSRWRKFAVPASNVRWTTGGMVISVLLGVEVAIIVLLSFQHSLGWDGLTVWELKARYAFLNGGGIPLAYFSDQARWFSHPEYPLLFPLTETWFYFWIGDCDQFWIKMLGPIWYLAGAIMLYRAAVEASDRDWVGGIVALLLIFVPAIHGAPGGVSVGYADVPLAATYIAALCYLLAILRGGSSDGLGLFVALASCLPWMKREGTILWATLMVLGTAALWSDRKLRVVPVMFIPGVILGGAWKIFLWWVHALPSRDFEPVNAGHIMSHLNRIGPIAREVVLVLGSLQLWDVFWFLVFAALVAIAIRCRNRIGVTIIIALLAPLVCYCATYLLSAWPDFIDHIDTSFPRLLIQLTPVGWLAIAAAVGTAFTPPGRPGLPPASQ